jgi:hypothetical protein
MTPAKMEDLIRELSVTEEVEEPVAAGQAH